MAIELTDQQTVTAPGAYPVVLLSAPVGGFTAQVSLDDATEATVRLQVRLREDKWLDAATFELTSAGLASDIVPVYPAYRAVRWVVDSIAGGAVLLDITGVGA